MMALRMRNNINVKPSNQENVIGNGKAKTTTTGLPKRSALGEIGNVQVRQTTYSVVKGTTAAGGVLRKPAEATSVAVKKKEESTVVKKKETLTTSNIVQTKVKISQTVTSRTQICKKSLVVKPMTRVPLSTSTVTATAGPSKGLAKPQPRLLKSVASSSSALPKPKPKPFPTRITVPVLPENCNFRDIDKETESNPIFLGEYANEIHAFLRQMELNFAVEQDFLKGQLITPKMRSLVVDWLVDVQRQYTLLLETLHLAIGIFDRFLQKHRGTEKTQLQLVGVTAMWIASKYEELFSPELENFVYITDRAYSKKQILKMEELIHKTLDFSYGQPLSIHFLRRYANASKTDSKHHTYAKYFLELALVSYQLRSIRPSLLAAVALFIARCVIGEHGEPGRRVWPECLDFYSTYTYDDVKQHVATFVQIIVEAGKPTKLQAVQKKYGEKNNLQVSALVRNKTDVLEKLLDIYGDGQEEKEN